MLLADVFVDAVYTILFERFVEIPGSAEENVIGVEKTKLKSTSRVVILAPSEALSLAVKLPALLSVVLGVKVYTPVD